VRKNVLEQNITPKAKQRLIIRDLPTTIIHLTRDPIEMGVGVIELPDQTRVPGGRVRSGEFPVSLQFARDIDRNAYYQWFLMCKDSGGPRGISPGYKKDGTIIFYRLFQGTPGNSNAGSNAPPVRANLLGLWPSQMTIPDADIGADEGEDGDLTLEVTLQYDDVELQARTGVQGALAEILG
jgi:hypothetical protein